MNSSVQNTTIFNSNTNTITFQTTHQKVTHTQKAIITEIVSRRTPTPEELEEMIRTMNINKAGESAQRRSGNFAGTTGQRRSGNFSNNQNSGISAKSTTKFKSADTTTSPVKRLKFKYDATPDKGKSNRSSSELSPTSPKTPTLLKVQEVTFSENSGGSYTSKTEKFRFKLNSSKSNSASSTNYQKTDARPTLALFEPTAVTKSMTVTKPTIGSTYISPYLNQAQYTAPQTKIKSTYIPAYSSTTYNSVFKTPEPTY